VSRIENVHAREVFDSRGKPTVEVEVTCAGGQMGRAIAPSGASTGQFEAVELRDHGEARLGGTGVRTAVENVCGEIAAALLGGDAGNQCDIDDRLVELDGTVDKSRLGANAILAVSLAAAHAAAQAKGTPLVKHLEDLWKQVPNSLTSSASHSSEAGTSRTKALGQRPLLPLPMINMISGGLHAGRNLDFQDVLILPVGAATYQQAVEWAITVYRHLGRLLIEAGHEGYLVGDEGGYGPKLDSNDEAVEFVLRAIEAAGYRPGEQIAIGLDVASTHFFDGSRYRLSAGGENELSSDEMIDLLESWVDRYPIISIEDGLADDDWPGWRRLTQRLGHRVQIIGDDLFVTNTSRLERGLKTNAANAVLIKLNQIGTLWETLETLRLALDGGYWPIVSARSGETEDTTIADLVVATGAGQIKIGSVVRSERLVKYNQLLRLEEQLGTDAGYLGGEIFAGLGR